jgi:hypothetical protein
MLLELAHEEGSFVAALLRMTAKGEGQKTEGRRRTADGNARHGVALFKT